MGTDLTALSAENQGAQQLLGIRRVPLLSDLPLLPVSASGEGLCKEHDTAKENGPG